MIEREFVDQQKKEYQIHEFISQNLRNVGHSHTKLQRTPLGEKIIIYASRPGLVVGRKGENISKLTAVLKKRFKLENPQIEISEVESPDIDAQIVAENIASALERFGIKRFKGAMHKALENALNAGAIGIEIIISGKVPSSRARSWRVFGGYLKKCGDMATRDVKKATVVAKLKSGVIGIKVSIMPKLRRPDDIILAEEKIEVVEGPVEEKEKESKAPEKKEEEKDEQKNA
ncbi:30S ribosomal protein S3 [Candidatus Woesearchaeota archaeon]|nr:30S ribosomal protein S3 [Candidatus Woesearchaeota archaeon]